MMKFAGYIFLWMTLSPVLVFAQGRVISLAERDSVVNPALLCGEQVLHFDTPELNIGSLQEDAGPQTYRFRFTNIGKDTVLLNRIQTSCGCAEAAFDRTEMAPGENATITVVFRPSGQVGTIYKQAFVYTGLSEKYPTAKIAWVGEVKSAPGNWRDYPCSMGNALRLKRLKLQFTEINRSVIRTERLVCVNSGPVPLKLSALLLPAYAAFRTEPETIYPGEEADIVIIIDGHLLPPEIKDTFRFPVLIEGINARPSDRTLWVEGALQNKIKMYH